jgi:hypothetical protein
MATIDGKGLVYGDRLTRITHSVDPLVYSYADNSSYIPAPVRQLVLDLQQLCSLVSEPRPGGGHYKQSGSGPKTRYARSH